MQPTSPPPGSSPTIASVVPAKGEPNDRNELPLNSANRSARDRSSRPRGGSRPAGEEIRSPPPCGATGEQGRGPRDPQRGFSVAQPAASSGLTPTTRHATQARLIARLLDEVRERPVSAKSLICRVSTGVVQRFCKPKAGGSNPSPGTSPLSPRILAADAPALSLHHAPRFRVTIPARFGEPGP